MSAKLWLSIYHCLFNVYSVSELNFFCILYIKVQHVLRLSRYVHKSIFDPTRNINLLWKQIVSIDYLKPVAIIKSMIIVFIYPFYKSTIESVLINYFLLCEALNVFSKSEIVMYYIRLKKKEYLVAVCSHDSPIACHLRFYSRSFLLTNE